MIHTRSAFVTAFAAILGLVGACPMPGRLPVEGDPDAGKPIPTDASPAPLDADPAVPAHTRICDRWIADRADLDEGVWSGNAASCSAGDISARGRANALRQINLYRWLAALPPVAADPALNASAQTCALLMHANSALSHQPSSSWACYTNAAATAAAKSNLARTPGVSAIDLYMIDWGSEASMVHRRWLLSSHLGPIGLGSTSAFSCMWVVGGKGMSDPPWTAYPPPGPFPYEAAVRYGRSLDQTGWTLQSDSIDLSGAQARITANGQKLPIRVVQLPPDLGSKYAIAMVPEGWVMTPGSIYRVEVTGTSSPITYRVEPVACQP